MPSKNIEMMIPGGRFAYLDQAKKLYAANQAEEAFQLINDGIRINIAEFENDGKQEQIHRAYIASLYSLGGIILFNRQNYQNALNYLYMAQELDHKSEINFFYSGLIYIKNESPVSLQRAITAFSEAAYLNPSYAGAYFYLSQAQFKLAFYADAFDNLMLANDRQFQKKLITEQIEVMLNDPQCVKALSKENIVAAIKLLPDAMALNYIDRAIDQRQQELLSKKMWSARFFTKCSLEKGTLKELVDYKKLLEKRKGLGL